MANLFEQLNNWATPWLDDHARTPEQRADATRARLLFLMCLGTVASGVVMTVVHWGALGDPVIAAIHTIGIVVMAGTWPVMRWSESITFAANWASLALVLTVGGLIPFTGVIESPGIGWLVLAPIFALVFGDRTSGFIWGGIVVLLVVTFHAAPFSDPIYQDYAVVTDRHLLTAVSTVLLMFVLAGLFVAFQRYNRELIAVASGFRTEASLDSLTNLANRRAFERQLSLQIRTARRHRYSLSVCFLDIDAFKSINDEHGHAAGDAVLVEIGDRLDEVIRDTDLVARTGGDEFAVLLEGIAEHEDFERVVRRIKSSFEKSFVAPGTELNVDCSIGFGLVTAEELRWLDEDDARERVLELADAAMYEAKRNDRDWVVERLGSN